METNLSLWHLNREKNRIETVVNTKLDATKTAVEALKINAATVNNCTIETNVPKNALFITQAERNKLATIQEGAQVNTSNFNKIRISDQLIVADGVNSTLTFTSGRGITLTPNPNSDTIDISAYNLYEHPQTHSIQMITGVANVAKTGNYNDLLNKPSSMPANGGNADTLDDKSSEDFIQRKLSIDINIINNSNYRVSYMGDIPPNISTQIGLQNEWYHIIYIPHTNSNGLGCQIVSRFKTSELSIRSGNGTTWGNWVKYSIDGHNHNYNNLLNKPTSLPANGGNSDTVDSCHVNDSLTNTTSLWTSSKISTELNKKSNANHGHNYNDLTNKPSSLPANGGNADTVDSCHVNDGLINGSSLWTSSKINAELNNKANANHSHGYLPISGGSLTGKLLLQNGSGTNGGFSFVGDGASDTGIFSPSDGIMNFYNNGIHTYTTDTTGIVLTNGRALKHGTRTIIGTDGKVYNAVYNDLAEWFKKGDNDLEAGDIVSYTEKSLAQKCDLKNNKCTVGVYSDTYGFCLGGETFENMEENKKLYIPIGISGRVRVKVTGDIEPGDFITCSHIPGVGVKGDFIPGKIVGKALESHTGKNIDRIWILIMNI